MQQHLDTDGIPMLVQAHARRGPRVHCKGVFSQLYLVTSENQRTADHKPQV